jgi:hypothetical protein
VRRVRRWSFVLTVPVAIVFARVYGVEQGAFVIGARVALWLAVAIFAWRLGGERGEAVRDLLMHPRARALMRAERDIVAALPLLVLRGRGAPAFRYTRGSQGLPLALAFTPPVLAEAVAAHLLIGGGWIAWVVTGLHAYTLLWLWAFMLGPYAYPHRPGVLRSGALYRVVVPPGTLVRATERRERVPGERGLVERDGAVLLPSRGRVELWLEFAKPVRVQRPLGEPLLTTCVAVASDDPDALAAALLAPPRPEVGGVAALAVAELAYG